MVSKQFTTLSVLMPVAMSIGVLISIYAYKNSQQDVAIIAIVGSAFLVTMLFFTYGRIKKKN